MKSLHTIQSKMEQVEEMYGVIQQNEEERDPLEVDFESMTAEEKQFCTDTARLYIKLRKQGKDIDFNALPDEQRNQFLKAEEILTKYRKRRSEIKARRMKIH